MTLPRILIVLLALAVAGAGLVSAQDQPLAAGSDGVPVPKKKKHVQPVYPPEALAQGIRGIVILDLVIDTEGRVAETHIIRSIPGLDEAALVAARQWLYEPVKVDGRPVSVRLTVPITFALKLPEMTRQEGIPELRQGVTPPWPEDGKGAGGGVAVAEVTLEPSGRIGLARVVEGEEPWSTSLLQALRTWRFRAPPADATVSFRVAAEFTPGGGDTGRVALDLSGLRESRGPGGPETAALEPPADVAPAATAPPPQAEPAPPAQTPEAGPRAPEPPGATAEAAPETAAGQAEAGQSPRPATEPSPSRAAEAGGGSASPEAPPTSVAETGSSPSSPPASVASPPREAAETEPPAPAATPSSPAETPETAPVAPSSGAEQAPADEGTAGSPPAPPGTGEESAEGTTAVAQAAPPPPPTEVLSVAPPPLPPENGISAIRGVELEPGVPDLTRGRRPVSPPFARMQGASGEVTVQFSVSAGGVTTVQRVEGPEILQPAARGAVESWVFRRTRADRAYLVARFTYDDDLASAIVRPQQ